MFQAQTNKHIDVMNCILGMSKPQLEQLSKMIHGIIQRETCLPMTNGAERPEVQSSLQSKRIFKLCEYNKLKKDLALN